MSATTLGERLRALRRARYLTQAQLAERIGSTQAEVSRWERDSNQPYLSSLQRLCEALGVEPAALLGRTEESV